MITGRQIRAARGLLGWDASVLAQKAGITRETISRIETDNVQPQEKSLSKILRALDESGVEFTDHMGVRMKQQDVEILQDTHGFSRFFDIVYEYVSQYAGHVCISGVDESLFSKYRLNTEEHRARMTALNKARGDFNMQILTQEGDHNFAASGYAEYRWLPKTHFSRAAFYVFGHNLALISFDHVPPPLIILIKSAAFADAYRNAFDIAWSNAIKPPKPKAEHHPKKKD